SAQSLVEFAPVVTAISPASGSTAGGTNVTITGAIFSTGAGVRIGGNPATNVVVASANRITATTPPGTAGPQNVTVTNPNEQSGTLVGGFTYVAPSLGASAGPPT